jgi:Malectin-like domain
LSINCGLPANTTYVETNDLTYVSDDQFVKTGVISNISSSLISQYGDQIFKEYLTVRYFPTGVRNCYTIRSLTPGFKYLIRANFFYGNYDNLYKFPIFDIYLGANFWNTVNTSSAIFPEIIITATADYLHVCLINKGQGIPFISSLHLRKLEMDMYPYGNSTTTLILVERANLGGGISVTRSVKNSKP